MELNKKRKLRTLTIYKTGRKQDSSYVREKHQGVVRPRGGAMYDGITQRAYNSKERVKVGSPGKTSKIPFLV